METEDHDEAYHSGLAMMSASEEFKEEDQQGNGKRVTGSHPAAGTPAKERSTMNMVFGGKGSTSKDTGGSRGSIKPTIGLMDAVTPTTHLTGQLQDFNLRQKASIGEAKATLDSPSEDVNDYPSLDLGYTSMPSMDKPDETTPLPANTPQLITSDSNEGEEMEVDRVTTKPSDQNKASAPIKNTKEASKIDIKDVSLLAPTKNADLAASETSSVCSQESSSLSPAPVSMLVSSSSDRSESPTVIPHIAEDIEISTEGAGSQSSPERRRKQQRQEGLLSKRSAAGLSEPDLGPSTKNPRLSPEVSSEY